MNSTFGGLSSSSSPASAASLPAGSGEGGFKLPKENGVVEVDPNEKPVVGGIIVSVEGLPKPENPDVLGLSSLFKPKLNPFVFGGEMAAVASELDASLVPKLKKLGLGVSSLLATVVDGFTPKLKMLETAGVAALVVASDLVGEEFAFWTFPNENRGAVAVVVVPPLVTVQLGFLPKLVDGEVLLFPMVEVGLPKEKPSREVDVTTVVADVDCVTVCFKLDVVVSVFSWICFKYLS